MVFKKGVPANPKGKNGNEGYIRYGERMKYLQSIYTIDQILEIVGDQKKFRKLAVRDGMMLVHLANTFTGDDIRLEREALLDRIEGKAAQTIDVNQTIGILQIVLESSKPLEAITEDNQPECPLILDQTEASTISQKNEFKQHESEQANHS